MSFFNFWKKKTTQNEETSELLPHEKVNKELKDIQDSMRDSLLSIDTHIKVNQISFNDYVANVIMPQYKPLTNEKDKELAKHLIENFKEYPNSIDGREFLLTNHFFGSISGFIDYDTLREANIFSILNGFNMYLEKYLNATNSKMPSYYGSIDIHELRNTHIESLNSIISQINQIQVDNEGKPIDYNRLLTDTLYRQQIRTHYSNIFNSINKPFAKINDYVKHFEFHFKQAQVRLAFRQRFVANIITTMLYVKELGNYYNNITKSTDEDVINETLHEWLSITYPQQWEQLLNLHSITVEQLNNSENPDAIIKQIKVPTEWHKELFEHISRFVDNCAIIYDKFLTSAKEFYVHYQTDLMVCTNLSKLLHSAYFDKRKLYFLMDTYLNIHYSNTIEQLNNALVYNTRDLNPHLDTNEIKALSDLHFTGAEITEEFIATAENKIKQAQNIIDELKKKALALKNSTQVSYVDALNDANDAVFQNQADLEYYINQNGKHEVYLNYSLFKQFDNSFLQNINIEQYFKYCKNHCETMYVKKDYHGVSFQRFFNALPQDVVVQVLNYFKGNVQLLQYNNILRNHAKLVYLDFIFDNNQNIVDVRIAVCTMLSAMLDYTNENKIELNLLNFSAIPFGLKSFDD